MTGHRWAAAAMAACVGLIGVSALEARADDPAAIVKERQEFMGKFYRSYLKDLAAVAKGENTDLAVIEQRAAGLTAAARKIVGYFPAGTGRDAVPASRARPEVWTDRAGFEATTATFVKEAEKLESVAKTGQLDAIKTQISATAQACFGCHDGPGKSGGKYRFEEK